MTGDQTTAEVTLAGGQARYVAEAGAVDYRFEMQGPMPGGALTIGGMTAAFAISAALNAKPRGSMIDVSMLESLLATMAWA